MILIVCNDDTSLGVHAFKQAYGPEGWDKIQTRSSAESSSGHVPIFWDPKTSLGKTGPTAPALLEQDEDLILTAHGNPSQIGNQGSADSDYNIDAEELGNRLSSLVLPKGYTGNIYLSACRSLLFGRRFRAQLLKLRPNYPGKVFGYSGSPSSSVNVLDSSQYEEVTL